MSSLIKNIALFTTTLHLTILSLTAQVVWTDPSFPSQYDDITVYFNAAEGNQALKGFTGDVYAHTGVITGESANGTDWKHVVGNWGTADARTLMTKVSDDIYSLTYNIDDFYGIPPGVEVLKLAFVFRNVNGSIVGRNTDGSDIFYSVYPPDERLRINLFSPAEPGQIYLEEDSILIDVRLSDTANLEIFDNSELIFHDTVVGASFFHLPTTTGLHELFFRASNDTTISLGSNFFVISNDQVVKDPPPLVNNGLNYYSDSTYIFQLYAPLKKSVFLLSPANAYQVSEEFRLNQSINGDFWWIELPQDLFINGQNTYQYLVDGKIKIADPFSKVVLDPGHDPFVRQEVMNELPSYPTDLTTGIVTAFDLEKSIYDFSIVNFEKPQKNKLVIYELLVRDFLSDHSFVSLKDTIPYLKTLGINAIELMPINEFEGNISWGYNPSFHMAVDKYYGSRTELKSFIDAAHANGIAVILDVVYNHAFSQSPLVQLYWDATNFRPSAESPYFNVTPRHPFNVGYDVNHESEATKIWVKQTLSYWINEFKVDGFRFDLSKGFTQFNSGDNAALMARYDAGRIAILKDYADHIWSVDSTSYVILEHFADNDEEIELSDYGTMLWGNMNHSFSEAAKGFRSDLEGIDYTARSWNRPHLIGYMESHDEERLMYRILREGDQDGNYNTRNLKTALSRMEAASTIFYLVPGPKMIWQFGELGYDYSINYCQDGTVRNECRLDLKPVRWDYLEDSDRRHLQQVNAALIHLKTKYPTFSSEDFEFNDGNLYVKTIRFSHPEMDALVVANFRVTNSDFIPKFPYSGIWYDYFSGDSLLIENTEERISFVPGEYHIFTSKKIDLPDDFVTSQRELNHESINIYPNLVSGQNNLYIDLEHNTDIQRIYIYDISGKQLDVEFVQSEKGITFQVPLNLSAGIYFVRFQTADYIYSGKFIKH